MILRLALILTGYGTPPTPNPTIPPHPTGWLQTTGVDGWLLLILLIAALLAIAVSMLLLFAGRGKIRRDGPPDYRTKPKWKDR